MRQCTWHGACSSAVVQYGQWVVVQSQFKQLNPASRFGKAVWEQQAVILGSKPCTVILGSLAALETLAPPAVEGCRHALNVLPLLLPCLAAAWLLLGWLAAGEPAAAA